MTQYGHAGNHEVMRMMHDAVRCITDGEVLENIVAQSGVTTMQNMGGKEFILEGKVDIEVATIAHTENGLVSKLYQFCYQDNRPMLSLVDERPRY